MTLLLLLLSCSGKGEVACAEGFAVADDGCEPVAVDTTETLPTDSTSTASSEDTATGDTGTSETSETDTNYPAAELDAESVGEQLQSVLAYGLADPLTLIASYEEALEHRENECPFDIGSECTLPATLEGCYTSDDWFYAGPVSYIDDQTNDHYTIEIESDFSVAGPDGEVYLGGGIIELEQTWDDDLTFFWDAYIAGTFGFSESGGLAGLIPGLYVWSDGQASSSAWSFTFYGAQTTGLIDVYFDDLVFDSEVCGDTPVSGGLQLRGDNAYWYEVVFDGCGGCGAVTYAGVEALGEICLDFGDAAADHADTLGRLPTPIPCRRN